MKINENMIKKNRTEGTSYAIGNLVSTLDLTSLMSDIYIYTDNPFARELIKRYEFQLIEAHENFDEFQKSLHFFYQQTAAYIKKNNLYKEFFSFCYFIFSSLKIKEGQKEKIDTSFKNALNCYYNILFQQMNYFVPHPKVAYGVDSKGELMLCEEPYPYIDTVIMEVMGSKTPSLELIFKKLNKLGYNIRSEFEFNGMKENDQLITNMILTMASLMNEHTKNIHPKKFLFLARGIELPAFTIDSSFYKEMLKEKRYFLPKEGVMGRFNNCGDIQEILLQEIYTENRIILLYKLSNKDGESFNGFYDNHLDLFYSPFGDTNNGGVFHKRVENLVLEIYSYLTTDIEGKMKDLKLERRIHLKEEIPVLLTKPVISVEFLYDDKQQEENSNERGKSKHKKETRLRAFNKKSYQESRITIHPFIRRLPVGAKASEEAIELARTYHFVLREGETFVRPFERTTYRKDDD